MKRFEVIYCYPHIVVPQLFTGKNSSLKLAGMKLAKNHRNDDFKRAIRQTIGRGEWGDGG
jgi:hypothetical protein